jgi:hypothetical protein
MRRASVSVFIRPGCYLLQGNHLRRPRAQA